MESFISLIIFFFFITLIIGLIKPSLLSRFIKRIPSRKQIGIFIGTTIFALALVSSLLFPSTNESIKDENLVSQNVISQNIDSNLPPEDIAQITESETEDISQTENLNNDNIKQVVNEESQANTQQNITNEKVFYQVSSVVDGDTLKVNIDGKIETIRLIGMDTPEVVDPRKPVQCFGIEASNKAKELLTGKKVSLESDSTQGDKDKYNRLLRYVYLQDGLFFNKYMIEQGFAFEYTYNTPYKYQTEFKAAQKLARENNRGLWSPNTCNGDTAIKNTSTTSETTTTDNSTTTAPPSQSTGKYYTSSYSTTKYYSPEVCDYWKSLSPKYLKSFNSLEELLAAYPNRTLSPQCQ